MFWFNTHLWSMNHRASSSLGTGNVKVSTEMKTLLALIWLYYTRDGTNDFFKIIYWVTIRINYLHFEIWRREATWQGESPSCLAINATIKPGLQVGKQMEKTKKQGLTSYVERFFVHLKIWLGIIKLGRYKKYYNVIWNQKLIDMCFKVNVV